MDDILEIDKLVDAVTKVIMQRLNASDGKTVAVFGEIPDGLLGAGFEVKYAKGAADVDGCDYIVLSTECFRKLHGYPPGGSVSGAGGAAVCCEAVTEPGMAAAASCCAAKIIDLKGKRLIHERDIRDRDTRKGDIIKVDKKSIVTALAFDYVKGIGAKIEKE